MQAGPPDSKLLTRRQRLLAILREREMSFDDLRRELEMPVRLLEDDLRHLERSLRGAKGRLRVLPARCRGCGYVFRGRSRRHLHTPGRCPRCKGEQVDPAWFRAEVST